MLDLARCRASRSAHVLRPFPARLVTGTADHHRTDSDDLELPFRERSYFVRLLEPFDQEIVVIRQHGSCSYGTLSPSIRAEVVNAGALRAGLVRTHGEASFCDVHSRASRVSSVVPAK